MGWPAGAAGSDLIGQLLGDSYRVDSILDEGGMGTVLVAEHLRLHRPVAIKVLARHLARDSRARVRFETEAEIVSRLQHPHIVSVLDYDTTPSGQPYIVMELLRGESLEDRLARGVLTLAETTEVVCQIASGLAAAHAAAIVHRDMKPGNIFLVDMPTGELFVKLLDFGLGKHVGEGRGRRKITNVEEVLGTPAYMAPEQAIGGSAAVDHRADQFALAAIIHHMLAGASPFEDDTIMGVLQRVAYKEAAPLCELVIDPIPEDVGRVVARALSKAPEERYHSIVDFTDAFVVAASPAADLAPTCSGDSRPARVGLSWRPSRPNGFGHSDTVPGMKMGSCPEWPVEADPAREVLAMLETARGELDAGEIDAAVAHAEQALRVAETVEDHAVETLIDLAAETVTEIFERRLGGQEHQLGIDHGPSASDDLCPWDAFVLSRLDGGATVEEVLDMAGDRLGTLRSLVKLARQGMIH